MSRRVNFTSFSDGDGGVKLPNIRSGFNWVADRPEPRRFQSEPRHQQQPTHAPLPPAGHNGGPPRKTGRFTAYMPNGYSSIPQYNSHREQSLPARKPKADNESRSRKINSAPDYEKVQSQGHQKPKVTIITKSEAPDVEIPPEMLQRIHGVPTRAHEENYLRSNKFASSWAQVRAENLALRDGSPVDNPATHRTQDSSVSPGRGMLSKNETSRDSSPHKPEHLSAHPTQQHQTQRFVITRPRGRPPNKQRKPREKLRTASHVSNGSGTPGGNNQKFLFNGDSEEGEEGSFGAAEGNGDGQDGRYSSCERKPQRPAWNSNVNVFKDSKPPPKINSRRYEAELTFKPTLTSTVDVYNAYTDKDKFEPGRRDTQDSDDDEAYISPFDDSDIQRSNSSSPNRSKERVLSKREAEMYIKMSGVYGSDAYKNQRKEWFLQRLAKVQEMKEKLNEDKKKADQKKKEEDLKRQTRQLNYVRKKFRREQRHRFRTQYVTSRVLEHEYANRHEFGLPEDFDEFGNVDGSQNDNKDVSHTPNSTPATKDAHGRSLVHNGHRKSNFDARGSKNGALPAKGSQTQNKNQQKMIDKQMAIHKQKKQQQEQKRMEEKKRAQEQQRAWYNNDNPPSEKASSSVGSHVTSGYESSKTPLDQQSPDHDDPKAETSENISEKLTKSKPSDSQRQINDSKSKHGTKVQRQQNHKSEDVRGKNTTNHAADNKSTRSKPEKQNTEKQGEKESTQDNDDGIQEKDKSSSKRSDDVLGKDTSKTGKGKKNEKEDKALVYTGHFRQERDTDYHQINDSDRLNEDHVKAAEVSKYVEAKPNRMAKEYNALVGGNASPSDKDLNRLTSTVHSSNKTQGSKDDPKVSSTDQKLFQAPEKLSLKDSSSKTKKPNSIETDQTKVKSSTSFTKDSSMKKDNNTNSSRQNGSRQDNQNSSSRVPKPEISTVKTDIVSKRPSSATEKNTTSATTSLRNKGFSTDRNPRLQNENNRATKASVNEKARQESGVASETNRTDRKQNGGLSSNQRDIKNVPNTTPETNRTDRKQNNGLSSYQRDMKNAPFSTPETLRNDRKQNGGLSSNQRDMRNVPTSTPDRGRVQGQETNMVPKSSISRDSSKAGQKKGQGNAALAAKMFDVKTGPSWDPKSKVPKMEGIDTVVVKTQDGKGRVVKRKKNVKDVVKEADDMLKAPVDDSPKKDYSRQRNDRVPSPDVTLGSDFDVDDDEDETENDIFERLRKKYNIKIDSDDEDDSRVLR